MALKSYFRHNCNVKRVHILTDNSTALAYINNVGGMHSVICNDIAKRMWEFAQNRDFWISSSHIPIVENTMTDKMSIVFSDNTEWMLSHKLFKVLCHRFQFNPPVNLFATLLNKQIVKYAVNALSFSWKTRKIMHFPLLALQEQPYRNLSKTTPLG